MNRPSRDNVLSIRAKALPVVVTMPSRESRAEGRGAAVLQMPARFHRAERKAPVVLAMPSRSTCTQRRSSSVVEMPSRITEIGNTDESSEPHALPRSKSFVGANGFSDGLRMTLVALFALLGWPRPTHGKDPGAAAARPFKLELLNVISKLQIPGAATAGSLAARSAVLEFPQSASGETFAMDADLARAA